MNMFHQQQRFENGDFDIEDQMQKELAKSLEKLINQPFPNAWKQVTNSRRILILSGNDRGRKITDSCFYMKHCFFLLLNSNLNIDLKCKTDFF